MIERTNAKRIIGMIHLAGGVPRALEEIALYQRHGLAGALVENYHGSVRDIERTLGEARERGVTIPLGVNILPNEFETAYDLAERYGASFIQLDHVAGMYARREPLDVERYGVARASHPTIEVFGGVWPKYYRPVPGSNLADDIRDGCARADVLVVTGEATGVDVPLEKIQQFRALSTRPLCIGAGIGLYNAREQLALADGAIVGSYFKDGDTNAPVDEERVQALMKVVHSIE